MPPTTRRGAKLDIARTSRPKRGTRVLREQRKVVIWNMQGGSSDGRKQRALRNMLQDVMTRVICLQECSDLFGWTNDSLEADGWRIAVHEQWHAGGHNKRCSLAILTRSVPLTVTRIQPVRNTHRPIVGVQLAEGNFYSMHAPSGGNVAYVDAAVRAASVRSGSNFFIGGDFNLNPTVVTPPVNSAVINTGKATHNGGNELDYGVARTSTPGTWNAQVDAMNTDSDHRPVVFTFNPS